MEWIKNILENHRKEDGTIEVDAAMDDIKKEFPKNAVPKDVYNQTADDLKNANKLVDDLKKENKDVEGLQKKITDYEKEVEDLKAERLEIQKTHAIKEALQKEGAADVDYMLFKLGELEVDEDGNVKDLENKVKELKEANPTFFASEDKDEGDNNPPGYEVVDNGLENGKPSDPAATATAEFEKALGLTTD
ncbi:phage scaffolding protein [Bacillus subtilis]